MQHAAVASRGVRVSVLASALLAVMLAASVLAPAGAAAESETAGSRPAASLRRLSGPDRYETSLATAREFVDASGGSVEVVVVASGASWADALVAAALAGSLDAPVLLVERDTLRLSASEFVRESRAAGTIVVGSTDAVSDGVLAKLARLGATERISGDDRIGTSVEVARRIGKPAALDGHGATVLVATAEAFADAMVAGGLAASGPHPMLLTAGDELDPRVETYLRDSGTAHAVVLGGEAAVSASVADAMTSMGVSVTRIGGETRLQTAERFAAFARSQYAGAAEGRCPDRATAGLATAWVPFDAMSAAPLLGLWCAPLLLTAPEVIDASTAQWINEGTETLVVLGGTAAVSSEALSVVSDEADVEAVFAAVSQKRAEAIAELRAGFAAGSLGIDASGVLSGPGGFRIDLSRCPEGWRDFSGVTSEEIRIGLAGPSEANRAAHERVAAGFSSYLRWVNQNAPVDGRRVTLVSSASIDGGSAAEPVGIVTLAEEANVLAVLSLNTIEALNNYDRVNQRCVPHPFVLSAHPAWGDPQLRPWTTGHQMSYGTEAVLWGEWIRRNLSEDLPVTVGAVVMDNNFGRVYEAGFRAWAEANPAVVTEFVPVRHFPASIDATHLQMVSDAEPDVFISMTAAARCIETIQLAESVGLAERIRSGGGALFTSSFCQDVDAFMIPAGQAAAGWRVMHGATKDLTDAAVSDEPFVKFMRSRLRRDSNGASTALHETGFSLAYAYVEALRIAAALPGGLTRSNLMLAVRSLDIEHPLHVAEAGYRLSGNTDAYATEASRVGIYDASGRAWQPDGAAVDAEGLTPPCHWSGSRTEHAVPHCGTETGERLGGLAARGSADEVRVVNASARAFASDRPGPANQLRPGDWRAVGDSFCVFFDESVNGWRTSSQPGSGYVRVNGEPVRYTAGTRIRLEHGDVLTLSTVSGGDFGARTCAFVWSGELD